MAVSSAGLHYGGFCVNHLDIATSHAGVISGIANMFSAIPACVGPLVAKVIAATVSASV